MKWLFVLCVCLVSLITLVSAFDVGMTGDQTGYGVYRIYNVTNISADQFCDDDNNCWNATNISTGGSGGSGGSGNLENTSGDYLYNNVSHVFFNESFLIPVIQNYSDTFTYSEYFDQDLNTSDSVSFANISSDDWTNVSLTLSQISDYIALAYSDWFNQNLNTSHNPTFQSVTASTSSPYFITNNGGGGQATLRTGSGGSSFFGYIGGDFAMRNTLTGSATDDIIRVVNGAESLSFIIGNAGNTTFAGNATFNEDVNVLGVVNVSKNVTINGTILEYDNGFLRIRRPGMDVFSIGLEDGSNDVVLTSSSNTIRVSDNLRLINGNTFYLQDSNSNAYSLSYNTNAGAVMTTASGDYMRFSPGSFSNFTSDVYVEGDINASGNLTVLDQYHFYSPTSNTLRMINENTNSYLEFFLSSDSATGPRINGDSAIEFGSGIRILNGQTITLFDNGLDVSTIIAQQNNAALSIDSTEGIEIIGADSGETTLVIQGNDGDNRNITEWINSTNDIQAWIESDGLFRGSLNHSDIVAASFADNCSDGYYQIGDGPGVRYCAAAAAGNGSQWIIDANISYLYNDSTTLFFNETTANTTFVNADGDSTTGNYTFADNITVEATYFENSDGRIYDNSTCIIIAGPTSTLEVC